MRILVIEDDETLAGGIRRALDASGYRTDVALDGATGLEMALSQPYDLHVVDIMLPAVNGFKICEELRRRYVWAPILMVTAKQGEWDQAESLEIGADDYLTKPVSMVVLLAHVKALIRRAQVFEPRHIAVDGLTLDRVRRTCGDRTTEVALSSREAEVLACLMTQHGHVVPKADLVTMVWGDGFRGDGNIVEVYVRHLRNKLERPFGRTVIETVRGAGYRFSVQGERD
jgi:two-component system OmpR family response regulator